MEGAVEERGIRVALMSNQVFFQREAMRVLGNSVYFEGVDMPPGWNFASCQASFEYFTGEEEGRAVTPAPITFSRGSLLTLSLDAYRNGLRPASFTACRLSSGEV
jgi:hypothetical protein